jgi:hypothetical protein
MTTISKSNRLGRFGTRDQIAKSVVFLASNDSSYIRERNCLWLAASRTCSPLATEWARYQKLMDGRQAGGPIHTKERNMAKTVSEVFVETLIEAGVRRVPVPKSTASCRVASSHAFRTLNRHLLEVVSES